MTRSSAPEGRSTRFGATAVLSGCLFISGAAALIYEILWFRYLSLVMGHTVYALSAMLTAFLGGLALGAYLGGSWSRRRGSSARLYAGLEVAIAAMALGVPGLIRMLDPLFTVAYSHFGDSLLVYSAIQFAAATATFLLPTVCMGATLPIVMAAAVGQRRDISSDSGRLYALNSLGGVVGLTAAGFVLLPALGMRWTGLVAVSLNLIAAAAAFLVAEPSHSGAGQKQSAAAVKAPPARARHNEHDWPAPGATLVMLCYAVSGFAALTLEVAWSRLVGLVIGSTVFGFTMILATYITGLALGSYVVPRLGWVKRNPVRTVFGLHIVIALATVVTLPYLGNLPVRAAQLMAGGTLSFHALLAAQGLLVLSSIVVPTFAMGGLFPLVAQLLYHGNAASGAAVGATYAANTLGNILGSLAAGFVLIPALGTRATIILAAVLSGAVGLCYIAPALLTRRRDVLVPAAIAAACIGVSIVIIPPWREANLISAPFMLGAFSGNDSDAARASATIESRVGELVEFREGPAGSAAVSRLGDFLLLRIDGVKEAVVGSGTTFESLLGHIPMLVHGRAQNVLIIGLGSGATLNAVLRHPVSHADSIEISADVVELVRRHFSPIIGNFLDDPRLRQIVGDGRNFLRHTDEKYDVIISQPSHPWQSGAASLFTREYFSEIRDHLAEGGVACSWFWAFNKETQQSVIRAWLEVFDNAYLFVNDAEILLIGRRDSGRLRVARMAEAMAVPAVRDDLARHGINHPTDVLFRLRLGTAGMAAYAADLPINADDNAFVEFNGLRGFEKGGAAPAILDGQTADPVALLDLEGQTSAQQTAFAGRLTALWDIQKLTLEKNSSAGQGSDFSLSKAKEEMLAILLIPRQDDDTKRQLAKARSNLASEYLARKMYDDAIEELEKAIALVPQAPALHFNLGNAYQQQGKPDEARKSFTRAVELEPNFADAYYNLGMVYFQQGQYDLAIAHIDRAAAAGAEVPPAVFERIRPYRK